jgi:glycosyltransferase involved in cell wall biosynthesis
VDADLPRLRVLFLGRRVTLPADRVPPHGSGAHTAATVAGLRANFDVEAVVASEHEGAGGTEKRRTRWITLVPPRLRGAFRDLLGTVDDARFMRRALTIARTFHPDVVYERSEYLSLAGVRVARKLGVPLVLEVNGVLDSDVRAQYRSLLEPIGSALERFKHRRASLIVVESPGLAALTVARGGRADRIVIAPNSVEGSRILQSPQRPRPQSAVVGFLGHLMPWHADGVRLLIDIAPTVIDRVPHARFRIIGGGPDLRDLQRLAHERGLADRFDFIGPVLHDRVQAELAAVDVGVIVQRAHSFPVKIVEMGAVGIPVVAPRHESLDLLLAPGEEYEPFQPSSSIGLPDAVVRVLLDVDLRARLGEGLWRATRERFTWDVVGAVLASRIRRTVTAQAAG